MSDCTHVGHLVRGNEWSNISARTGRCRCIKCGARDLPDPETKEGDEFYV